MPITTTKLSKIKLRSLIPQVASSPQRARRPGRWQVGNNLSAKAPNLIGHVGDRQHPLSRFLTSATFLFSTAALTRSVDPQPIFGKARANHHPDAKTPPLPLPTGTALQARPRSGIVTVASPLAMTDGNL